MTHGRTGRRARFLFVAESGDGCSTAFVTLFVVLFALGGAAVLAALAVDGARELANGSSVLHRLSARGPRASAPGRVVGTGFARGRYDLPVCYVAHQHYVSGKNGGWRTDQRAMLAEGATLSVGGSVWLVDPRALRFDPLDDVVADEDLEARLRERDPGFFEGGRLRAACARDDAPVFVDACVSGANRLGRCPDGGVTTLTLGDGTPRRRIRAHASDVAAKLSAGVAFVVLLALYAWRASRAAALVDALRSWNTAPPAPSRALPIAGLALSALGAWGVVAVRAAGERGLSTAYLAGYALGVTAIAGALVAALLLWDRRAKVTLAMEPVLGAETSRLARVGDGPAELAVRVRRDAPTVLLPDHAPHAFVRVAMKRVVQSGRNVTVVPLHAASWPARVPVEDPSGQGVLDITEADIDTRATFRTVSGDAARALLAAYAQTPFGDVRAAAEPFASIVVEESYVDPGESLYLLGHIARVEDPDAQATYRAMGTVPVVGSSSPARLVVHAGSERSLLTDLARERAVTAAAAYALVAASCALLAALVYLRALA